MKRPAQTRLPSLAVGTPVLCLRSKFLPEYVSKRSGKVKPSRNLSTVYYGRVVRDLGDTIEVKVKLRCTARTMSFFYHEITLEENFICGLTN